MSRKPTKGYFVQGHFVAEGSELDLELKRELKGTDGSSRTDLKRESTELQALGEELLTLRTDLRAALGLSDKLIDALDEAKRITNFEGRRRQMQFVGKLMRKLDEDTVAAVRAALETQHRGSAEERLTLREAETWRDALIGESDDVMQRWMEQFPATDSQQLRALIRQARKDAVPQKEQQPGEPVRHGRAYREVFQLVRAALGDVGDADADTAGTGNSEDGDGDDSAES